MACGFLAPRYREIDLAADEFLWLLSGTLNSVPSLPLLGVVRP